MESTIPKYTGGGLLPVLVGAAIDAHVTHEQQSAFDAKEADLLPAINATAKILPADDVKQVLYEVVQRSDYLKSIVRADSKNVLAARIVRFGLARKYSDAEIDPRMLGEIWMQVTITKSDGKILLDRKYSGASDAAYSMKTLWSDPATITQLYREALKSVIDVTGNILHSKYDG